MGVTQKKKKKKKKKKKERKVILISGEKSPVHCFWNNVVCEVEIANTESLFENLSGMEAKLMSNRRYVG